ncbi:quinol monooxygenase YgiN [Mycobacterium frederiksbergense]|uniref:Quinol monooxygenase YgiN n=1 Tax=Mycolicibacterium frederiksbergense TaxID=117567 RepID=A0ABT6KSL1_9MYCO|nr:antibiotic biosynthesis monooxygenase [Mycolicibacterium frederiksbergense]MDH6193624.1 quinol monooxygenase YgiN [Mycolicibacterium frederiksbergense]
MTIGFVAFHYPRPEHFEEFVGRSHAVRETLQARPGCLSAEVWATPGSDAVVTTGQFESEQALQDAFAAARGLGAAVAFDERELNPRQIFTLISR